MAPLQFWKPGTAGPGSTLDRESESEGSLLSGPITNNVNASLSLASQRTRLPIYKHREKLLYCVEKYGCVIVVGQTGCGKSTRKLATRRSCLFPRANSDDPCDFAELPQYLKEANWASENHVIACTQPRRVAATTVAARVAEEVGSVLGDEVRGRTSLSGGGSRADRPL